MDFSFADSLDPTAITAAAPAPSKLGSFADTVGNFIANVGGHPIDTESAYQTGRLHSAQTETALAQARERRAKALDEERITTERANYGDVARAAGVPDSIVSNITAGYNPEQMTSAQANVQKMGFADRIANPTSPEMASNARAALAPGSYNRYYQAAPGYMADNASAADPSLTDVGQSSIDANEALATHRLTAPVGGTGAGGGLNSRGEKAPANYRWSAADDTVLEPMTGGPKDPEAAGAMGAREAVYLSRVIGGATQSVAAIKNMMQLPVGANTGVMGIGAQPGVSILQATKDALRNKVADQDTQTYNRMVLGLTRNLATIETQGLAPPGSFVDSYNNLALRPGDTEMSKLQAMAEMRQTVETGLEPMLNNPRVPESQKQHARELITRLTEAVPFDWQDILDLMAKQRTDPTATLASVAAARGLGTGTTPPAQGPGATGGEMHSKSKSGKDIVSHDGGKTWEYL